MLCEYPVVCAFGKDIPETLTETALLHLRESINDALPEGAIGFVVRDECEGTDYHVLCAEIPSFSPVIQSRLFVAVRKAMRVALPVTVGTIQFGNV